MGCSACGSRIATATAFASATRTKSESKSRSRSESKSRFQRFVSADALEPLRRHVRVRAVQYLPPHAPHQPKLLGRRLALVRIQPALAVVARVGLEDLERVLVDDHLVAAHLAVDAIAGRDLELQRHAAPVGVAVDRDLAHDAVVVPGELRALLGDVPLLALLLLVA